MCQEKALKRLGYTEEWLAFGIISEEYLMSQYDEIKTSEDQNAEHYRCGGFGDYLRAKESLTDLEVNNIFLLKDNGPDNCDLHEDRIIQLIYRNVLSDEQLESIAQYPEVMERPIQKRYLHEKLVRKINRTSIDECFGEIKTIEDSAIHEYILNNKTLLPKHALWLAQNGSNKKIRNVAKQLCNSKKFMRNA